jgi:hypothetical protein
MSLLFVWQGAHLGETNTALYYIIYIYIYIYCNWACAWWQCYINNEQYVNSNT